VLQESPLLGGLALFAASYLEPGQVTVTAALPLIVGVAPGTSRDVLEHIERVLTHVRRLESSAETAVQMHFSEQNNRTNDIMRALTVLTAIFLPLNFVTGFFGMNFEGLPLIHSARGFWVVFVLMLILGVGLSTFFWRKRYLRSRL